MNKTPLHETHSLSFHPTVWRWLVELAHSDYDGNASAAVSGLVIYNRGVANAKRIAGQSPGHHLTRGIPQNAQLLEATIREIEGSDPGFNARSWLECEQRRAE